MLLLYECDSPLLLLSLNFSSEYSSKSGARIQDPQYVRYNKLTAEITKLIYFERSFILIPLCTFSG
jgi:hypothetical protein